MNDWHIIGTHDGNINTIGTTARGPIITHHTKIIINSTMFIRYRGHERKRYTLPLCQLVSCRRVRIYHKFILACGAIEVQRAVLSFDLGIAALDRRRRRQAIGRRGIALYSKGGTAVVTARIFQRARGIDAVC